MIILGRAVAMPTMAEFGSVCSVSKNPDCLYDVNWFLKC